MRAGTKHYGLLVVIGLSAPLALAFESLLRRLLLPPEFEEVRAWLGPMLTPWVWAMVPATVVATLVGVRLQAWVLRREYARLRRRLPAAQANDKAQFEALMLATSAPQLPAVAATLGYMFGCGLVPVVVTMIVSTAGELVLGWMLPRQASRET